MATKEQKIKENLQLLGRKSAIIFSAKVDDVNKQESTITIVDNYGIEYPDVRLKASIKDTDSVLLFPKKNSNVLVAQIGTSENDLLVIAYDEVEEIQVTIENISFVANKDEIQLNGDTYKGLVKVEQLTQKLNTIETAFNQLVNEFNAHTHNAPQAPAGTLPTLTPLVPSTQNLNSTQVGDLENEKVKHG